MRRWLTFLLGCCMFAGWSTARAGNCVASMTDINFGQVTAMSGVDYYASGSLTVTCTWDAMTGIPPQLLFPNVAVCVGLGAGSNGASPASRVMANGGATIAFNLYRDGTYAAAAIWGNVAGAAGTQPLTLNLNGLLGLGQVSRTFAVYGKLPTGALAGAPTTANADTVYTSDFNGHATVHYAFYNLGTPPSCTAGGNSTFAFKAQATIINDCLITVSPVNFGVNGALLSPVRATSSLSVQCTNGNAYQIALNGGTVSGSPAARHMRKGASPETVSYKLSASLDGDSWGDGSAGAPPYTGVGNGSVQTITVFGVVPVQPTPSPGQYSDRVTATIYF